jgi:hypothetical protein
MAVGAPLASRCITPPHGGCGALRPQLRIVITAVSHHLAN